MQSDICILNHASSLLEPLETRNYTVHTHTVAKMIVTLTEYVGPDCEYVGPHFDLQLSAARAGAIFLRYGR